MFSKRFSRSIVSTDKNNYEAENEETFRERRETRQMSLKGRPRLVISFAADDDDDEPFEDGEVVELPPEVLEGWWQRAKKKYRNGVTILRVTSGGKLVRRQIFVDAKEEYFEITSGKLFDIGYHLSDVNCVTPGCNSKAFQLLVELSPNRIPNPDKCCIVEVDSLPISLVFKTQADRRDFIYLIRVQTLNVRSKYQLSKLGSQSTVKTHSNKLAR